MLKVRAKPMDISALDCGREAEILDEAGICGEVNVWRSAAHVH